MRLRALGWGEKLVGWDWGLPGQLTIPAFRAGFPQVLFAMAFAMAISYRGLELPRFPVSDGTSPKCARNAEIRARHEKGESIATLAEVFGIPKQRIWQILNYRRK